MYWFETLVNFPQVQFNLKSRSLNLGKLIASMSVFAFWSAIFWKSVFIFFEYNVFWKSVFVVFMKSYLSVSTTKYDLKGMCTYQTDHL